MTSACTTSDARETARQGVADAGARKNGVARGVRYAIARMGLRLTGILLCLTLEFGRGGVEAQSPQSRPGLKIPSEIAIAKGGDTPVRVDIEERETLPPMSFVRVTGLPETAKLTQGYRISANTWAIPIAALNALAINMPGGVSERILIEFAIMALDGEKLAGATVALTPERREIQPTAQEPVRVLRATPADKETARPQAVPITRGAAASAPSTAPATRLPQAGTSIGARSQPVAPPASTTPQPKALTEAQRRKAQFYVRRGDQALRDGNVNTARLFFKRAADIGLSLGARALAETFDEREIRRLGAIGLQADAERAEYWYGRARVLRDAGSSPPTVSPRTGPVARQ